MEGPLLSVGPTVHDMIVVVGRLLHLPVNGKVYAPSVCRLRHALPH